MTMLCYTLLTMAMNEWCVFNLHVWFWYVLFLDVSSNVPVLPTIHYWMVGINCQIQWCRLIMYVTCVMHASCHVS